MEQGVTFKVYGGSADKKTVQQVNLLWNKQKQAFPNAINSDLVFSETDMLACLYSADKLVAFARLDLQADTVCSVEDSIFIDILCVRAGNEKEGLGNKLLSEISSFTKTEYPDKDLLISTWYSNNRMLRLLKRSGYELQSTHTYLLAQQSLSFYIKSA